MAAQLCVPSLFGYTVQVVICIPFSCEATVYTGSQLGAGLYKTEANRG